MEYHFFSSNRSQVNADDVHWKTGAWELCSEDCAGGKIVRSLSETERNTFSSQICRLRLPAETR